MEIKYIREFVTLATLLNFTKTAERHYIAQPVLSRHIKALEKEMGTRLFDRTTHSVSLTEDGQYVYQKLKKLVKLYDETILDISKCHEGVVGSLSLGIIHYALNDYLDPVLKAVRENCPGVEVSTRALHPNEMFDALYTKEIDVGLTVKPAVPDDPAIMSLKIADEEMLLMLPTAHPLANSNKVSLSQLAGETFVLAKNEPWEKTCLMAVFSDSDVSFAKTVETDRIDTVAHAVLEHNGVAVVPMHLTSMNWSGISFIHLVDRVLISICLAYLDESDNPALPLLLSALAKN
jgi:DNA-binding transcriptional LysR family regulator